MQKNLLIVGIDPGTTTAYAILDLSGNVLETFSSKELDINKLISRIIKFGKIIAVGTDKNPCPKFVERFAIKTGGRVIVPTRDLTKIEKSKIINNIKKKGHEADALASAMFAFKELKGIIDKIKTKLEKENKIYLFNEVVEFVVLNGIAIEKAIDYLERPESEMKRIIEKSKEEKQKNKKETKDNYFIWRSERTRKDNLKKKIREMSRFLANLGDKALVKKIDNLTKKELLKKNFLNIKEGDILLVRDARQFDKDAINFLKEKISTILYIKKTNADLPFTFIDAKKLKIDEIDNFAAVDKKELEKMKNEQSTLKKIILDYKEGRKV